MIASNVKKNNVPCVCLLLAFSYMLGKESWCACVVYVMSLLVSQDSITCVIGRFLLDKLARSCNVWGCNVLGCKVLGCKVLGYKVLMMV